MISSWSAAVAAIGVPGLHSHDLRHTGNTLAASDGASLWWSAFWDKRYGVWRVAEDDPDSALYAESADAAEVLNYMTAHS